MGQVLHGCARTTEAERREIQNSKESMKRLSERLGLNYKTVTKWRHRNFVHDMPMGPKDPYSTDSRRRSDLRGVSQALAVAFGRLSMRAARPNSASFSLIVASTFSAQWHQKTP